MSTERRSGVAGGEGDRVQKILARAGVSSRRKGEELIRQGRVTVNGEIASLGRRARANDVIKVDGRRIRLPPAPCYLLLNKPPGYLSTVTDPEGRPTVLDLVPKRLHRSLHPVGRLDFNTEGLILLTTDGDFSERVAHPSFGCTKIYDVKVKGTPDDKTISRLESGIVLDGRRTAPCRITARKPTSARSSSASNTWWNVRLSEGRSRQIREMFQRAGHPVQRLRRVAIGALRDPKLPRGAYRKLRPSEIESLLEKPTGFRRPSVRRRRPASSRPAERKRTRRR